MFAPEDVFNSAPLPRGLYWPSRLVNEPNNDHMSAQKLEKIACMETNHGLKTSTEGKNDACKYRVDNKIDSSNLDKENIRPSVTKVSIDCASTSIDGLIREIDENLAVDPQSLKPTPSIKDQIGNILSVSDHSDTTSKVMSPSSLQFYLNRFKHNKPTHPAARSDPKFKIGNSETMEDQEGQSIESFYNTASFDSSSYLERVVSSDDSTEWNFTNELDDNHRITEPVTDKSPINDALPDVQYNSQCQKSKSPSFLEQITGRSYSELTKIVPPEVINPPDDSQDILYQWRLKRHIAEAQNSTPDTNFSQKGPSSYKKTSIRVNETHEIVSRQIQTDAEKREFSCQTNLSLDLTSDKKPSLSRLNTQSPLKSSFSGSGIAVDSLHSLNKIGTPEKCQKFVHPLLSNFTQLHQDTCSDVTVSSVSSDDLTSISDLDEEDIDDIKGEHPTEEAPHKENIFTQADVEFKISHQKSNVIEKPQDSHVKVLPGTQLEIMNNPNGQILSSSTDKESAVELEGQEKQHTSQENTEELLSYLENIRDSLDDELLDVFIQRYRNVVNQMKEIENEINLITNED